MKTVCIYHNQDLDGWMSAAIVKHWWQKEQGSYIQENNHITNPNTGEDSIDFIGYNYGQPIPDLSEYHRVIMCDISFPLINMLEIADKLMDSETLESNFIWLDHHISAIKSNISVEADGIRNTKFAACELTWKYFFPDEPMPEIVRLLGRYDCFGHKNTNEEQKVLEFQYGARSCISNYEEAYRYLISSLSDKKVEVVLHQAGIDIYQYLCTEAKQDYEKGFEINIGKSSIKLIDAATVPNLEPETLKNAIGTFLPYKFICINKERFNPINFGIDYHKDGYDGCACFHYDGFQWCFSLYNDNGEVDCSVIAKQYGGGGHKGAAGFRIKNLNKVINVSNQ